MITEKESRVLSVIRIIAMGMIVFCHILQGLESIWAFVLNVGVQMFFFLSGYLYGQKKIGKTLEFYKKRFVNIYVPFAIWLVMAFMLLFIFSPEELSCKSVAISFLCLGIFPSGLEHLWFVPVIFVCYLLLPLFARCLEKKPIFSVLLFALLAGILIVVRFHPYFVWISVYYIGFLCGRYPYLKPYILFLSIVGMLVIGYDFEYLLLTDFSSHKNILLHGLAGIVIFLSLYKLLYITDFKWLSGNKFNGGTYEIYLTHQLFILGPLSLLFLTSSLILNLLIILLITIFSAMIVKNISTLLTGYFLHK